MMGGEICRNCLRGTHQMRECPEPLCCFRCGEEGHMTRVCSKDVRCSTCGSNQHVKTRCFYEQKNRNSALPRVITCEHCGKEGHVKTGCTSTTDARGRRIRPGGSSRF